MRSGNLQLPCVHPPTSSYNLHGHHGRHGHVGHGDHGDIEVNSSEAILYPLIEVLDYIAGCIIGMYCDVSIKVLEKRLSG